jgi:hypothetical protein
MANYYRALGLAAAPPPLLLVRYPPAARRYRSRVQATLSGLGCNLGCGCASGLGDSAQIASSASYAATGAKLGTAIVPGIGTVVGAVIGVVVGALLGKKKPVRPTAQDVAQCNTVLQEYESISAQSQGKPVGSALGEGNLKSVFVCYEMVKAGTTKDPRFLDGNWQVARDVTIEAVRKAFDAPPGTQVTLSTVGRKDIKGKAFRPFTVTYVNSDVNTLASIADKVKQLIVGSCENYHKGSMCTDGWDTPMFSKWCLDAVEWAATTFLPQIEIPKDIAAPIPQLPQPVQPLPAPISTPPTTAPVPVALPTLPPNASQADIQAAVAAVAQQFMQTQQAQAMTSQQAANAATAAAMQWLQSQGVKASPAAVADTAQATVAKAGSNAPLWIGAAAALFAIAMPASRPRVRRVRRRR